MSRTIYYAGCTQAEYLLNNTDQIVAYNLLCPLHMSSNLLIAVCTVMSRTIYYAGCTQAEYLLSNTDQIVAYNLLCPLHMSSNLLLLYVQLCRVQSIMPAVPKQSIYLTIPTKLSHIIYYAHCTCQVICFCCMYSYVAYNLLCRLYSSRVNLLNISDQLSLNTQTITVQYCRI